MEPNKNQTSNADFSEWMKKMESENAAQEKYARKQYNMARISAICSVVVLGIVLFCAVTLLPKLLLTFSQLETVMQNLEVITSDLAEANLPEMLNSVNTLVESSQDGMALAVERITALDIEGMNSAIGDLQAIISPLAKLFGR